MWGNATLCSLSPFSTLGSHGACITKIMHMNDEGLYFIKK